MVIPRPRRHVAVASIRRRNTMSVRRLLTVATGAALGAFWLAAPAAADVLAQPAAGYGLTAGRFWSLVAAFLGLAGACVGGRALARATGRLTGRPGAIVSLAAGAAGTVVGGLVVAAADGGPGTGYGIVGGYVALVVGVIAIGLGGLVLSRARRTV